MLAQEKAGEKLDEAAKIRYDVTKQFAQTHNVTLVEKSDALDLKMEKSNAINKYYDKLFLIFFKSHKQDAYLTAAINAMDVNGVEQNRNALLNYATAGLEALSGIEAYAADKSLVIACRKVLQFYKNMAGEGMTPTAAYIMATDNLKKIKKAFDTKAA